MYRHLLTASIVAVAAFILGAAAQNSAVSDEKQDAVVYELRTYTTHKGRLPALHKRFHDHTMEIFRKHGMKNVAYWTPIEKDNTLVYVISHKSLEAAEDSWTAFREDPQWKAAYKASISDGKIVKKVERQFLRPTDYSPLR